MNNQLTISRAVTVKECPWLDADLPEGMTVYRFHGPTYGCIGPSGTAVSMGPDEGPFFEVPSAALEEAK